MNDEFVLLSPGEVLLVVRCQVSPVQVCFRFLIRTLVTLTNQFDLFPTSINED